MRIINCVETMVISALLCSLCMGATPSTQLLSQLIDSLEATGRKYDNLHAVYSLEETDAKGTYNSEIEVWIREGVYFRLDKVRKNANPGVLAKERFIVTPDKYLVLESMNLDSELAITQSGSAAFGTDVFKGNTFYRAAVRFSSIHEATEVLQNIVEEEPHWKISIVDSDASPPPKQVQISQITWSDGIYETVFEPKLDSTKGIILECLTVSKERGNESMRTEVRKEYDGSSVIPTVHSEIRTSGGEKKSITYNLQSVSFDAPDLSVFSTDDVLNGGKFASQTKRFLALGIGVSFVLVYFLFRNREKRKLHPPEA